MSLGNNIKSFREELNMTIKELSNLVGISVQTLEKYESGEIEKVPSYNLRKICSALNTTIEKVKECSIEAIDEKNDAVKEFVPFKAEGAGKSVFINQNTLVENTASEKVDKDILNGVDIENVTEMTSEPTEVNEVNILEMYNKLDKRAKERINKIIGRELLKNSKNK